MRSRADNRGFTLIEILVAVLLFLIGAIVVARLQTTSVRGTTLGKEALIATTVAQQLMEQLKDPGITSFATVLAGSGPTSAPACSGGLTIAGVQAGTCTAPGEGPPLVPGMTIQWTVSNTTGVVGSRYTTVQVTVQWPNAQSYTINTVISEL